MTPFCVVQDQEKKKVVISIRGSMSLKVYTYVAIRICMKKYYTLYTRYEIIIICNLCIIHGVVFLLIGCLH